MLNNFTAELPSLEQLPKSFLVSLTHYSAIALSGEEKTQYLQGQVTCDVDSSNENNLIVGAHCNAKGKVFSAFRLITRHDSHLLIQPKSSITQSLAELKKFGVFAKVTITQTNDLAIFALIGEQAAELLQTLFGQVPDSLTPIVQVNSTTIIYIAGKISRYLLIDQQDLLTSALNELALSVYSHQVWDLLEINEGFPQLNEQTSGDYVPQMLNLQAINGISFTKGCYLGQETVARMQYLGKNKRALFALTSTLAKPLGDEEAIELQLGDNWRKAGDILASYQSDDGQCYLQAILNRDVNNNTVFRLKHQPEVQLTLQTLPYTLITE